MRSSFLIATLIQNDVLRGILPFMTMRDRLYRTAINNAHKSMYMDDKSGISEKHNHALNGSVGISFEDGKRTVRHYTNTSKTTQWLVKYSGGLIYNEKQAEYILIILIVLINIFTFIVIFNAFFT